MAKKPAKSSAAPAKSAAKAAAPAKAAKPDQAQAAAAAAPKKPAVPPKPVPAHQQFLSKGAHGSGNKSQHMAKGRIFRHQGR